MFVEAFLVVRSAPRSDRPTIERGLGAAFARGRACWPGVSLPETAFAAHLAAHCPPGADIPAALAAIDGEGLYLACACIGGDRGAMRALEGRFFGTLDRALATLAPDPSILEEVKQALRERLFLPGKASKLNEYSGRGALGRWIRAVAIRLALERLRRVPVGSFGDEPLDELALPALSPEMELIRRERGRVFNDALHFALATLAPGERLELRQYYLEGMTLEQLAALHRVVPSTISRRLAGARRKLLAESRRALRERLNLGDEELESLIRGIDSRLELSRRALLED